MRLLIRLIFLSLFFVPMSKAASLTPSSRVSPAVLEKELAACREGLRMLNASIDLMRSVPQLKRIPPAVFKSLGGALVTGILTAGASLIPGAPHPALMAGPIGLVLYATYRLIWGAGKVRAMMLRSGKLQDFVAFWPSFRLDMPKALRSIVEPVYASFAKDGVLTLNPTQRAALYTLLVATLNASISDILERLDDIEKKAKARKREPRTKGSNLMQGMMYEASK